MMVMARVGGGAVQLGVGLPQGEVGTLSQGSCGLSDFVGLGRGPDASGRNSGEEKTRKIGGDWKKAGCLSVSG